ncbi:beta-propeller fold lactonase family protein [Mucilaginibacter pedocola]|nr:beta-propeller fold lactonase family protein [Mucilaginibacter pedocola]
MKKPLLLLLFLLAAIAPCITKAQESQTVTAGEFTKPIEFPGGNCVYRWTNSNTFIGLNAVGGVGNIAPFKTVNPLPVPAIATFTAEPISSDFAYVPVTETKSIAVVSTATNSVVASVPVGDMPFGIAINPQGTLVYVSNGGTNTISVINTATNKVVAGIFVGENPRGITINADGSRVYVVNSSSDNVSVIDAAINEVIAVIPTGRTPVKALLSPDGSKLYTTNSNGHSVSVISLADKGIIATIPVGQYPQDLALRPDGEVLYVTNLGNNTVSVINTAGNYVAGSIAVGQGPSGIIINPDGNKAYVTMPSGSAAIIDLADNTVTTRAMPGRPSGLSFAPDGTLYIINGQNAVLDHYNADLSFIGQVPVGISTLSLGNFIRKGGPCTADPISFTITVNPPSLGTISNGPVSGDITSCVGTASASPGIKQFKVSGTGLADNIIATAPAGFEVSLTPAGGYGNIVSLVQSGGTVNDVRVYVRASATAPGGYISGSVKLTATGVSAKYVGVNGFVTQLPAVNNPGDKVAAPAENVPAISLTGTANIYRWTNDNPAIGLPASGEGDIPTFKALNAGGTAAVANIRITPVQAQLAYVANYDDNTVSVVDIARSLVLKTIPVGKAPNAVAVSPDGNLVFVSNYFSDDVSVISTSSNTVIKTIPVGLSPSAVAISVDGTKLYVANNGTNKVAVISTATFQPLDIITVGDNPNGLAVSHDGTRLYVLNYSNFSVSAVDLSSNAVIATMTGLYTGAPTGICISPDDSRLYVASVARNDITVFNTATYAVEKRLSVTYSPNYITASPDGATLYGTYYASSIFTIDLATGVVKDNQGVGSAPVAIAVSKDGNQLFVANTLDNNLVVLNAANNAIISKTPVGKNPFTMGNFIKESSGCSGVPIDFKITVNPTSAAGVITAGPVIGDISACVGTASVSPKIQRISVSGVALISDITASAPTGFEVSLSATGGYTDKVTIAQSGGKVTDVVVYVRSSATAAAGYITGNVTLASAGAAPLLVNVRGIINNLPTVDKPADIVLDNAETVNLISFTGTGNTYTWVNNNTSIGLRAGGSGNIASFTAKNTGTTPVVATIRVTPVSSQLAYISNFNSNTVSVINTANNAVVKTIPVGWNPIAITRSPDGAYVYVSNYKSGTISVINTYSNTVTATITVGTNPAGLAITADGRTLYVSNKGSNNISVINTSTSQVTATIDVGENPHGIALSHSGKFLYVVNYSDNNVSVVSTLTNTIVATIAVGGKPGTVCIGPDDAFVYVTNQNSGTVSVINTASNLVVAEVAVGSAPENITIGPDGRHVYVSNVMSGTVSAINTATNAVVSTIPVGRSPMGVSVSSDGTRLFVANTLDGNVSIINTADNTVVSTITVGNYPYAEGDFIKESTGCPGVPMEFTITVNPTESTIMPSTATVAINACTGSNATESVQNFTVSAKNLTADVTATAPAGFEISLSENAGFGSTLVIPQAAGKINNTIVYLRLVSTATNGTVAGNVVLSSAGANIKNIAVTGIKSALPLVNNPGNREETNGIASQPINFEGSGGSFTWVNDNPSIGLAAGGNGNIPAFMPVNRSRTPVTANVSVTPLASQMAYIANLDDNSVSVVDLASNSVVKTIPVGRNPNGVAISRDGSRVYASNYSSNSISVISALSNTVTATIPVPDAPLAMVVSADAATLYVANNGTNTVSVINTATLQITGTIAVGEGPGGLVLSHDGKRLYSLNQSSGSVSVIDVPSNTVSATIGLSALAVSFCISPDDSRIYATDAISGDIVVVNATTNTIDSRMKLGQTPRFLTISPDGKTLYANDQQNSVLVIDIATQAIKNVMRVGILPLSIALSDDGKQLFVTLGQDNALAVYNTATNALMAKVLVGKNPFTVGNFIREASSCNGAPVTFDITVNPPVPIITAGPATGTISACVGTTSSAPNVQRFLVSGKDLFEGIAATAPAGFEVSLSIASGYGNNVLIPQAAETVDNVTVYVRATASGVAGTTTGDVTLTTAGGSDKQVRVSAFINALPTVSKPGNQSVDNGVTTTAVNFTGTGNSYTWVNDNPSIGLGGSGTGDIPAFNAVNTGSTPAVAKVTVTPQLKSYIYVANSSDNAISVINPEGGAIIKTIPVGTLPYGITVSPNGTRVYVSNISDGSMSVINAASNAVIATVPVGSRPFGISVSPDGSRVYVANETSNTVSVIDGVSNSVIATIPTGQYPVATLVSPDGNRLYVANQNSSSVSVFNTSNNTLVAEIPTVGQAPAQMACSPGGGVLYVVGVGNQNTFQAFDATTFRQLTSLSFSKDAHAIAVTPDGSKIYVTDNTENKVWVLDGTQLAYTGSIPVGNYPNGVSVSPDGNFVYVVNGRTGVAGGGLSVIGTAIDQVLYTLSAGNGPISIGNFVGPTTNCPGDAISFTITVAPPPPPVLSLSATLTPLTTVYGTPSTSQSFSVSGANIVSPITITAPAGFEVSADNNNFSTTATITGSGTVAATAYIRLTAKTAVDTYNGNIVIRTPNATDATLAVPNSTVTPAMLIITADNKTKLLGADNPILTVTYNGFVNNENEAVLSRRPDVSSTATTTSVAGDYPITAGNALAQNYNFRYVPGVLTIQRSLAMVTIPNTFTPNDDGVNDTWNLTFLQGYNKATVNIFDRWGGPIYSSVGYDRAWDGKRNGAVLPAGTYYYIINPKDGQKPRAGWVSIVR